MFVICFNVLTGHGRWILPTVTKCLAQRGLFDYWDIRCIIIESLP